jgi:hypothetical protein
MFVEKYFSTSQLKNLRRALQWKSCALEDSKIARVCRQLYNAYSKYSNVNVLSTAIKREAGGQGEFSVGLAARRCF